MTSGELLSRRSFLVGVSAAGGGLALSLAVPFEQVRAGAEKTPEVTAWLLIGADDSVVVRVARAEMGQGAQTGLAMLVAEELECDWSKVRTEFVTPQDNARRGGRDKHLARRGALEGVAERMRRSQQHYHP